MKTRSIGPPSPVGLRRDNLRMEPAWPKLTLRLSGVSEGW
jgi:hypothetical protein